MSHNFFVYWPISRHLNCFRVSTSVNTASVNIGVQLSHQDSEFFLLAIYPEVELLDHMIVPVLIFWGTSILFFIVAAPIYISSDGSPGFSFLHIPTHICLLLVFFYDSYSKRDEVLYHCGLICIYLMIIDAEHFFLLAICISSLGKCLFNSSAHFRMGFLFLLLRSMSFSYILDINPYQMCDLWMFPPIP